MEGNFEVVVNGDLVWSKASGHGFPTTNEHVRALHKYLHNTGLNNITGTTDHPGDPNAPTAHVHLHSQLETIVNAIRARQGLRLEPTKAPAETPDVLIQYWFELALHFRACT